jgi:hypothetical protein
VLSGVANGVANEVFSFISFQKSGFASRAMALIDAIMGSIAWSK